MKTLKLSIEQKEKPVRKPTVKEPLMCPGGCNQTIPGCKCREIDAVINSKKITFSSLSEKNDQSISDYFNKR